MSPIFDSIWTFSQSGMIGLISSLLHLFRHLETTLAVIWQLFGVCTSHHLDFFWIWLCGPDWMVLCCAMGLLHLTVLNFEKRQYDCQEVCLCVIYLSKTYLSLTAQSMLDFYIAFNVYIS